jgi:FKBP-type peptidyl-prolyl cis-trans isomerase SlpA
MSKTVQANSQIRWHYQLFLADGYRVEASENPHGDVLQLGRGEIHPNLEAVLPGLAEGEKTRFIIMASEGFGLPDPDAVQTLPRERFPETLGLEIGQIISFALPSGQEIPGKVLEIGETSVKIDFNHPLAGHNLRFDVEIVAILD